MASATTRNKTTSYVRCAQKPHCVYFGDFIDAQRTHFAKRNGVFCPVTNQSRGSLLARLKYVIWLNPTGRPLQPPVILNHGIVNNASHIGHIMTADVDERIFRIGINGRIRWFVGGSIAETRAVRRATFLNNQRGSERKPELYLEISMCSDSHLLCPGDIFQAKVGISAHRRISDTASSRLSISVVSQRVQASLLAASPEEFGRFWKELLGKASEEQKDAAGRRCTSLQAPRSVGAHR